MCEVVADGVGVVGPMGTGNSWTGSVSGGGNVSIIWSGNVSVIMPIHNYFNINLVKMRL